MFTHDLKPFGTSIRKVQTNVLEFQKSFDQINKRPFPDDLSELTKIRLIQLRSNLSTLFQSEYQHFEKGLSELESAFANLESVTTIRETTRVKRALFSFVGDIASKLFGVATESDIKHVNKGLNSLKGSEKETLHLLKDSMSVVNKTNENVKSNRKIIKQLLKATNSLNAKLEDLYKNQIKNVFLELDYAKFSIDLHSLFHAIDSALDSLTKIFLQFSSQVNDLHMGTLPYDLAPPKTLQTILLEIERQLPPTLMLPYSVTYNMDKYYKTLRAVLIPDEGMFHVLTSVPLAHTTDQYDLYKIVNLPFPITQKKAIEYIPEYPYLAITQDKSSYAVLSSSEASQCHHDYLDYCPLSSPSYDTDLNPSCILSLFFKSSNQIQTNCQKRVILPSKAPLLKHIVNGKWLSSSIRPYDIELSCDKNIEVIHVQKGIQVIDLKQGCIAYTSYFRLPPYFRQHSEHEITKSFQVLLSDPIHFQDFEIDVNSYGAFNETILSQIPDLLNIQPDLDQIKHNINNAINEVDKIKIENSNPVMLYVAIVIGSLGLFLSLLIILVYYRKKCLNFVIGYNSHKREKVYVNDRKIDIEEAMEMVTKKSTNQKPTRTDCKLPKQTETLEYDFEEKIRAAKALASK